jgi:guanylate kinase
LSERDCMKGKIFILSGPSGAGKTTLYQKLIQSPCFKDRLEKVVSSTTRKPRPGEIHGKDYYFLSLAMFRYKKRAGHFLETQKVFDNYYGTPIKLVREILRRSRHVLLCIDVRGARVVKKKFPEAVGIFVNAPSLRILKQRLHQRGSENETVLQLRMDTAAKEILEADRYEHVFVNDDLEKCYAEIEKLILKKISMD